MRYIYYMEPEMIKKIDSILDRVKEPESGMSLAQMGLVERVRYSQKQNTILVLTRAIRHTHGCCTLLALAQQDGILSNLEQEFKKEFPYKWIKIVNV